MKVLLVNPPIPHDWYNNEYYLPSSLLYLGAALRQGGHEVRILDFKAFTSGQPTEMASLEEKLRETLRDFSPALIGFGCLFSGNFPDVLKLSLVCKANSPETPIVAGGIHFTIYAREILENCPSFDYVVLAEGERTIVALADALSHRGDASAIGGLAFRHQGSVRVNEKANYIENADDIPFPAYDLVKLEDYYVDTSRWHNPKKLPIRTSVPIISSRSCPNKCNFCSMYMVMGPKWRSRSAGNVVDEIQHVYDTYGHRHFSFMDDNLTLNKQRALDICNEIIRRGMNIQYETPNGLSLKTLDREVLDAMVASGLVRVSLAIESGSDYIRNTIMRKHLSREKIHEVMELIKSYPDLFTNAFFIIGMPEETKETLQETYDMIREIDVDKIHLMNIVPFPCTPVFEQAKRDGLLVDINVDNLYRANDLYFKNYDRFFIKPYALELDELREFRRSCEALMAQQRAAKAAV